MSIFSSLSYLLKKASVAIHQVTSTVPSSVLIPAEEQFPQNFSFILGNKSLTNNSNTFNENLYIPVDSGKLLNEVNSSFGILTTEDEYTSDSDVQFSSETFINADLLIENWWNIFDKRYLRHGWGWTITLIIAYMLILIVGVVGNLMVILVVSLRPQMRTVTNMFILNLAVADLFVVVFCVPSTLLANIFAPWILGSFLCKALAYVQGVSICASAYSLAAISLDRCQAIYRNLERPRGFSRAVCVTIVFVIWVAAISLTIPWAIMFKVKVSEYDGLCYCVEIWDEETDGNLYFLAVNLICFYIIPLLLIFVSSWFIYFQVTHREVPQDSSESSAPIRKMHRQTRHDVLKMLGIVTLTFLFSWLPLYILMIIIKFSGKMSESEYYVLGILMPIAQWLGSWNSSMNPILYAFLNKKFRRMLKSILPSWIPVNSTRQNQSATKIPGSIFNAYTERRGSVNSRNNNVRDYHGQAKNGQTNRPYHTAQLLSKYEELSGKVKTTAIKTSLTSTPTTPVYSSRRTSDTIFDADIYKRNTNEIMKNL